jgi:hypothetical protein
MPAKALIPLLLLVLCTACNLQFATPQASTGVPVALNEVGLVPTPTANQEASQNTAVALALASNAPPTNTPRSIATLMPSPTEPDSTPEPVVTFTPTPIAEPAGCLRPPDDYMRVWINGSRLNKRTVAMLRYAKTLYNGTIDFPNLAITQGSYNPGGVTASFGTHDGGGAVDISLISTRTGAALRSEAPNAIRALRVAGFAAWVREVNELYRGSSLHIHAIAIGDQELSPSAREQLTGKYGYFLGYNGLPQTNNIPIPDRHGGPVLCQWMLDMGYRLGPGVTPAAVTP